MGTLFVVSSARLARGRPCCVSTRSSTGCAMLFFQDPTYESMDVERFVELAESVSQGLRDTDYLAYSAIFADPSGNMGVPGKSSKDFLEKTRLELVSTLKRYNAVLKMIGI
mmetsp:Transcript_44227/g.102168  ORF Transcript_44227/g.102168 Transcript_44227/m.102168 type:complete len:111 (-) Transcript_44227:73-405(-)